MDMDIRVIDLARDMLLTVVMIAGPMLAVGLIVGVAVSVFQALTSVQEQTLSMVPKMLSVVTVALLLIAPALALLKDFFLEILGQLNDFGLS